MNILHYTLGFSPIRTGGLVGYSTDLMCEQKRMGYDVFALYPGSINYIHKKAYIKRKKRKLDFEVFELINSLPLAIFGGIRKPKDFMVSASEKMYENFLRSILPDAIHVHTLMGIHIEFFQAAKKLNIPIFYTTHDYFGLAPDPTFFYEGKSYDQTNSVEYWMMASQTGLSTKKLRLFQSRLYPLVRKMSNLPITDKLFKKRKKEKKKYEHKKY